MAEAYQETTDWGQYRTPNHTYLLDGDKMLAYIRQGTHDEFWFKTPIRFDRRGRKFQRVDNQFTGLGGLIKNTREVKGSKGQTYVINLEDQTCTCPGYTFRGTCKHVKDLETA